MPKVKFERPVSVKVKDKRYDYPAGTHTVPAEVLGSEFIQHWIAAGFAVEVRNAPADSAKAAGKKPVTAKPQADAAPVEKSETAATTDAAPASGKAQ